MGLYVAGQKSPAITFIGEREDHAGAQKSARRKRKEKEWKHRKIKIEI